MAKQVLIPGVGFVDTSGFEGDEVLLPGGGFFTAPASSAVDLVISECYHLHDADGLEILVYFSTNFGEYTPSAWPADWTKQWDTAAETTTYFEVDSGDGIYSDQVLHSYDPGAGARYGISCDDVGVVGDVEVLTRVYPTASGIQWRGITVLRGSGGATTEQGYIISLYFDDYLQIAKFYGGNYQSLSTGSFSWEVNTWYWVRARVVGYHVYAKIWADGDAEPGTWTTSFNNTGLGAGYEFATGWVGLQNDGNGSDQIDWFSVGTGGHSAQFPFRVAESYHEHVAENLVISETSTSVDLVIAECSHLHDADTIALTQTHTLAVNEAYHDHAADQCDVTSNVNLTVAECHHEHYGDGLTLTQKHSLTVAEAYHDHLADAPVLTQVHALAVNECYHDHLADSIILVPLYVLTVAECYHVHDVPNITITGTFNLSINESYHLHYSKNVVLESPDTTISIFGPGGTQAAVTGTYTPQNQRWPFSTSGAFQMHNRIRVRVQGPATSYSGIITKLSVGIRSGSSNDMASDPQLLTFSGAYNKTLPVGSDVWSDWVPFSAADGAEILVHIYNDTGCGMARWSDGRTRYYQVTTVDGAENPLMGGFTASETRYIKEIQITASTWAILDAAHQHTADNLTITQKYVLAVNEASHVLTDDAPITLEGSVMPIDEAYHLHEADSPALTQLHSLAVDESYHTHIADDIALAISLAVAESYHAHSADQITLVYRSDLPVDEAYHLNIADDLALTQTHILSVQGADHLHDADILTLGGTNILPVAESFHDTSADSITLTQTHTLVIDGADHIQTAENIALTQEHGLSVAEAYHAHASDQANLTGSNFLDTDWCAHETFSDNLALTVPLLVSDAHSVLADDGFYLSLAAQVSGAYHTTESDTFALGQLHRLRLGSSEDNWHILVSDHIGWPYLSSDIGKTYLIDLAAKLSFDALGVKRYAVEWTEEEALIAINSYAIVDLTPERRIVRI